MALGYSVWVDVGHGVVLMPEIALSPVSGAAIFNVT
jgi:hypothetical protein